MQWKNLNHVSMEKTLHHINKKNRNEDYEMLNDVEIWASVLKRNN